MNLTPSILAELEQSFLAVAVDAHPGEDPRPYVNWHMANVFNMADEEIEGIRAENRAANEGDGGFSSVTPTGPQLN